MKYLTKSRIETSKAWAASIGAYNKERGSLKRRAKNKIKNIVHVADKSPKASIGSGSRRDEKNARVRRIRTGKLKLIRDQGSDVSSDGSASLYSRQRANHVRDKKRPQHNGGVVFYQGDSERQGEKRSNGAETKKGKETKITQPPQTLTVVNANSASGQFAERDRFVSASMLTRKSHDNKPPWVKAVPMD